MTAGTHFEGHNALELYRSDSRLEPLLGPGGPFEIEPITIGGVPLRSFVRAPATVVDIFKMSKAHEHLTHLVFADERLTFAEVRQKSLSVAAQLRSTFGIGAGDRVAIGMRNFPEFVVGFWATAVLGAIVVPLNSWWTGPELAYALGDAGVAAVFVDEERLGRLASAPETPAGLTIIGVRAAGSGPLGSVPFEELADLQPLDEDELATTGPDDPATLLYTSGTTGRPKGALGSNRATIANLMNMAFVAARAELLSGRTPGAAGQAASIAAAPLFHIGGVASIVGGALGGTKVVLMPRWDAAEALALAERERVTTLGGIPAMARQILDYPDLAKFDLSAVRSFPLGGAPVPPDLPIRARQTFGPALQILNGYGLTETTSAVVTNVGDEFAEHPDSVGRPNLTADLRVEGPDGQPLGFGSIGELCFRSPQVVNCYWNDPEGTRAAFIDGWFHSGDLGYIDEAGFVYVVDRLKDVVIRGGENVYCAEVEAALFEHPAVADVAVIGLPDPNLGERVCAVVVPREDAAVDLAEVRTFAARRLAAFKCPEALFLTEELPRTPTGKTAKPQLRVAVSQSEEQIQRTW
jgi:acyl-CoA synthetase (AMP-forming)/AMP-acid ligase II